MDFFRPCWEQWLLILLRPLMSSAVDGAAVIPAFSADLHLKPVLLQRPLRLNLNILHLSPKSNPFPASCYCYIPEIISGVTFIRTGKNAASSSATMTETVHNVTPTALHPSVAAMSARF